MSTTLRFGYLSHLSWTISYLRIPLECLGSELLSFFFLLFFLFPMIKNIDKFLFIKCWRQIKANANIISLEKKNIYDNFWPT